LRFDFESIEAGVQHLVTLAGWDQSDREMDRIDNSQGYTVGNLRFTDRSGNASNTRVNRTVFYRGRVYTAAQFHREVAPRYRSARTVGRKIRKGLTAQEIIDGQQNCRGPYLRHSERRTP